MTEMPEGFDEGGRALWDGITAGHDLDPAQIVQLTEACRAKDRLDKMDELLRGDIDTWSKLVLDIGDGDTYDLRLDSALPQANATANLLKQLLAALRLPDAQTGKRPQHRPPRGAYTPGPGGGKVSSLDRARRAQTG